MKSFIQIAKKKGKKGKNESIIANVDKYDTWKNVICNWKKTAKAKIILLINNNWAKIAESN